MNENFEHLEGWDLLVESTQYRGSGGRSLNLRNVADFAFLDMIASFILSNEYESAALAKNYADKTISYRNFLRPRLSGTDLYVSMNILANPDSIFSKTIKSHPEADEILRSKIKVHTPTIKRYLDLLADNKMTTNDASVLLLRIEKQLNITDSKLKSIRRLAQEWPALTDMQRELVISRMLQYYHKFAKRSELSVFLSDLAKRKGYEINPNAGVDAELANIGSVAMQPEKHHGKEEPKKRGWAAKLAPLAGAYAGYKTGYHLFGPKSKH